MAENETSTTSASAVSAYEAKRLQRIQLNKQMMQSLGILLQPRERKRRIVTRDETVEPRRSSRFERDPTKRAKLPAASEVRYPSELELLDMEMASFHDRWLGKQLGTMKRAIVMESLCPQLQLWPGYTVNRSEQWRNGVVLFATVRGDAGYSNMFTEVPALTPGSSSTEPSAVFFRWIAQIAHRESSPLHTRLVAAPSGDPKLRLDRDRDAPLSLPTQGGGSCTPETVLLFLRFVGGLYVYCGRLGYLGHDREALPMEFRWQLLDLDKIQWGHVKQLLAGGHH